MDEPEPGNRQILGFTDMNSNYPAGLLYVEVRCVVSAMTCIYVEPRIQRVPGEEEFRVKEGLGTITLYFMVWF